MPVGWLVAAAATIVAATVTLGRHYSLVNAGMVTLGIGLALASLAAATDGSAIRPGGLVLLGVLAGTLWAGGFYREQLRRRGHTGRN